MPEKVIDFSVNINPFGPPSILKRKWLQWFESIYDYPDPNQIKLAELISNKEQISMDEVLIGNGGAELITLLGRMLAGKNILIIQPTFSEYEKMCKAYDCSVTSFVLNEGSWELSAQELQLQLKNKDALFICNPNNPTGVYYSKDIIQNIMEICMQNHIFMIIDEAFYDFMLEAHPFTSSIKNNEYLIILRSLTKMYSIAGLRLGYMMANRKIIEKIKDYQPHWSVNQLALLAGYECLQDMEYVNKTRLYISEEFKQIFASLREMGYILSESKVNFYLLKDPKLDDQNPLYLFLLQKGLVPRHTMNFQGLEGRWLRFAIKQSFENDLLLEALREWKNQR